MTTPPPDQDAPHVKTVLRLAATMQRHALWFSVPLAVAAVVLGAVLRGTPGLIGALLGAVLGLAAGLVARVGLPVAHRLVTVCPCMVLVPGPHFLNGMIDLVRARIPLGAARLALAGLIVLVICAGLLVGLGILDDRAARREAARAQAVLAERADRSAQRAEREAMTAPSAPAFTHVSAVSAYPVGGCAR